MNGYILLSVHGCPWKLCKYLILYYCFLCRFQDDLDSKVSTWGKKDEGNKANFESFQIVSSKPLKKSNGLADMGNPSHSGKTKVFAEDYQPLRKRIFDPGNELVQRWHKIFLIACLVALFLDPLYFYLPSFNSTASLLRFGYLGKWSPCVYELLNTCGKYFVPCTM
jgi:hypothetical protein